jgi:hypothetical protein
VLGKVVEIDEVETAGHSWKPIDTLDGCCCKNIKKATKPGL